MADAHHFPLVGERAPGGIRSWRELPESAWSRELVEFSRTGSSYTAVALDLDTDVALERIATSAVGLGPLPIPNVLSSRLASGHQHAFYFLKTPVHRGATARAHPLRYLARVCEYFRSVSAADPGYAGVLSYNAVHGTQSTTYPRVEPYELGELARPIPRGWRLPTVATTDAGRNWAVFMALCKRSLRDTDRELEAVAYRLADEARLKYPNSDLFPDSEVREILRSVFRYRARWRVQGHAPAWIARQASLGRKSGHARRARVEERDAKILQGLALGLSQREVAAFIGVSRRTVRTAPARLAR